VKNLSITNFGVAIVALLTLNHLSGCRSREGSQSVVKGAASVIRDDLKITEIKRCAGKGIEGGPQGDFFSIGRVEPMTSKSSYEPHCVSRIGENGDEIWKLDLVTNFVIQQPKMTYVKSVDTLYVMFHATTIYAPPGPSAPFETNDWLWAVDAKSGVKRWERLIRKCTASAGGASSCSNHNRLPGNWSFSATDGGVAIAEAMGYMPTNSTDPWQSEIGVSIDAVGYDHTGSVQFKMSDKIDFLSHLYLGINHLDVDWATKTLTIVGARCYKAKTGCGYNEGFIDTLSFKGDLIWRFRSKDFPLPDGMMNHVISRPDSLAVFGHTRERPYASLIIGRDGEQKSLQRELWPVPFPSDGNDFPPYVGDFARVTFTDGTYGLIFQYGFNLFSLNLSRDLTAVIAKTKTELYKAGDDVQLNLDFKVIPAEGDKFYIFSPDLGSQRADQGPKSVYFERFTVVGKDLALTRRETVVNTQPHKWLSWAEASFHFVAKTDNGDMIQQGRYLPEPNRDAYGFIRWKDR
jgi:hypothetical protein